MDYQAILKGTKEFVEAATPALIVVAQFSGFILVAQCGKMMMNQHDGAGRGEDRIASRVALRLLVAALLIQLSTTMDWTVNLLFGGSAESVNSVVAYQGGGGNNFWNDVLRVCLYWVTLLGWIAAFRGLLAWNSASAGGHSGSNTGDQFWKGFWHLIGGGMCVNIAGVVKSFQS